MPIIGRKRDGQTERNLGGNKRMPFPMMEAMPKLWNTEFLGFPHFLFIV